MRIKKHSRLLLIAFVFPAITMGQTNWRTFKKTLEVYSNIDDSLMTTGTLISNKIRLGDTFDIYEMHIEDLKLINRLSDLIEFEHADEIRSYNIAFINNSFPSKILQCNSRSNLFTLNIQNKIQNLNLNDYIIIDKILVTGKLNKINDNAMVIKLVEIDTTKYPEPDLLKIDPFEGKKEYFISALEIQTTTKLSDIFLIDSIDSGQLYYEIINCPKSGPLISDVIGPGGSLETSLANFANCKPGGTIIFEVYNVINGEVIPLFNKRINIVN